MDVFARIAETLSARPEALALEFRGHRFYWKEIGEFADALRAALAVPPRGRMRVALVARNRPAHVAALLALLDARYRVAMVYAFQAADQLAEEIGAMDVGAVLMDNDDVSEPLIEAIRKSGAAAIAIDGLMATAPRLLVSPEAARGDDFPAGDLAIEMLTSGTTGRPKRIAIRFDTINRATADMVHPEPVLAGKADILTFPIGNISGLYFLVPACANMTPLVLLEKFNLDEWLDAVARHRPAYCTLPPPAISAILERNIPPGAFEGVGTVGVGASRLLPEIQEMFEHRYGIPILVGYGATEFSGVIASWTPDDYRQYSSVKRGSVGRARPGVALRVIDADTGRELDSGAQGVLEARVDRVGPEWTRTTDLASMDADGFLFLHGRTDDVINRGGFKLHPSRIEALLLTHPAVSEAVVVGVEDNRLGEIPVAVMELRADFAAPTVDELHEFAHRRSRPQEVPARFLFVDALPRTPSLKVRRTEVKAMARNAAAAKGN